MTSPAEWTALLEAERLARTVLTPGGASRDHVRAWWGAVAAVLKAQTDADARQFRLNPPPTEVSIILQRLARDLASGLIPDPIRDAAREGRRPPGALEQNDISWAVAYRLACRPAGFSRDGETVQIDERAPVTRICEWFGVKPRTVQGWVRSHPPVLPPGRLSPLIIQRGAERAGARYRSAGRSRSAIIDRDAKRRPAGA